jgi:hypothetical protein
MSVQQPDTSLFAPLLRLQVVKQRAVARRLHLVHDPNPVEKALRLKRFDLLRAKHGLSS